MASCTPLKDDQPPSEGDASSDAPIAPANGSEWAAFGADITSVQLADVTGDGKADLIALASARVLVWPSDGTRFVPDEPTWLAEGLSAKHGVFFADATGDGRADAILVADDGIVVHRAGEGAFGAAEPWCAASFYGAATTPGGTSTFFFDVTDDGKADAIAVYSDGIWVRPSDGSAFVDERNWTDKKIWIGDHRTSVANLGGAHAPFLVGSNRDKVYALPKLGESFDWGGAAETNYFEHTWTEGSFFGTLGTEFADADGDGRADGIAVEDTGVRVWLSNGKLLVGGSEEWWAKGSPQGAVATLFRDVNGDGRVDLVAVDHGSVRVLLSTGHAFASALP